MLVKCLICILFIDFPLPPVNSLTPIMELLVLRNVVFYLFLIQHLCVYMYSLAHDQRNLMFTLLNRLIPCLSITEGHLVTSHPLQQVNIHALYNLALQMDHPLSKIGVFCQCKNKTNFLEASAKADLRWCSATKSKITANVFWRLSWVMTYPLLKFPNYYLICNLKLVSVRNAFSLVLHWGLKIVMWYKRPALVTNHNFYIQQALLWNRLITVSQQELFLPDSEITLRVWRLFWRRLLF